MWITRKQLEEKIAVEILKKEVEYTIELLKKNSEINRLRNELEWKGRNKDGKTKR